MNTYIVLTITALMLGACGLLGQPEADGGYTFKERGDGPNQYSPWADSSGALTSATKGWDGYCNPAVFNTPASECGALGNDREKAVAAFNAGKPVRFKDRVRTLTVYRP